MPTNTQAEIQEVPYDSLILTGKEVGQYGAVDYYFEGNLGSYMFHVGNSITDNKKILYVYFNNKHLVTIHQTRRPRTLVGFREAEGDFMLFRFHGKEVDVFTRKQ